MSEIKTVTHEGNVYQIGGIYEFSLTGSIWFLDTLLSIDSDLYRHFDAEGNGWKLIREAQSKIGTITPASIELVDGAAYTYGFEGVDMIGIYNKSTGRFIRGDGFTCVSRCTNIRLMTVGSK